MNIFNSLGSNYSLTFVLKALFAQNKKSYKENLINFLEDKYQGKAILVYKGREAIGLALEALNLPKGSFVAINGFTCFAVYKAVISEGYDTEILDLPNASDLNFSAETLQKALKRNTKIKVAIIQNTLGYPCDVEKIAKICKENNIILLEDLAHSVGTVYENGKEAGTIGDFIILSFSQDKIIDTVCGGALIIRNKKFQNYALQNYALASQGDALRSKTPNSTQQGIDKAYPFFTFIIRKTYPLGLGKLIHFILKSLSLLSKPMNEGFYTKYDLPNWYCKLVLYSFENLEKNLEHRKQIVDIYNSMLNPKISYPSTLRYCILVENRKSLIKYLKGRGIYVSDIWYDDVDKSLPNANEAANTVLNLPTHKNVTESDAKKIAEEVNKWLKSQ